MRFIDVLASKLSLNDTEYQTIDQWVKGIETNGLTVSSLSNATGGGGRGIQSGNVEIGLADGITLRNPKDGARTIYLDPDGDAWFGSNIDRVADTALSIFSNAQDYNGESLGKGDLMLGDNSSGKANLLWDASTGKLLFRSGTTTSVEIGDGGIIATWGQIGGWTINATTLSASGVVLDAGNDKITVGTGSTGVVIDGSAESIASKDWVRGEKGWIIEGDGKAEFSDVSIRGSLKTAVLEKGMVVAVGTTISVTKGAGTLLTDVYFDGGTETATLKGDEKGNATWVVNDWIYMAELNQTTGNFNYGYYEITSSSDNGDGTFAVGLRPLAGIADYARYYAGCAFANFGNTGDGAVDIEAGEYTGITIRYNDGTSLPPPVVYGRFGDLYGMYGAGSNHYFGIGIGDHTASATGNFLTYNADGAGTFKVQAGDGSMSLDNTGLSIDVATSSAWSTKAGIRWLDGADVRGRIWSYDNGTNSVFLLENDQGGTGGAGGMNATTEITSDAGYLKQGKILLRASSDNLDNSSSLELMNDDAGDDYAQLSTNGWVELLGSGTHVGTGGLFVGASGSRPSSLTEGAITSTGNVTVGKTLHVTGSSTPASGVGIEMYWNGSVSRILSYNRTGGSYERLDFIANAFLFLESSTSTAVLTIDGGDIFSDAWTSTSGTWAGFSSITTNNFRYKRIGKTCYVHFQVSGTSNQTYKRLTLPFTAKGGPTQFGWAHAKNNGTWGNGSPTIVASNGTVLNCYWYIPTGAWTASGACEIRGSFFYETA